MIRFIIFLCVFTILTLDAEVRDDTYALFTPDILSQKLKSTKYSFNKKVKILKLYLIHKIPLEPRHLTVVKDFIFDSITNLSVADNKKVEVFQLLEMLSPALTKKEIKKYYISLKNINNSIITCNMIFKILYVNLFYTNNNRDNILKYVESLNVESPPKKVEYILALLWLISENPPYLVDRKISKKFPQIGTVKQYPIRFRILSRYYKGEYPSDESIIYSRIMTSSKEIISKSLLDEKYKDFFIQSWDCATVDFYYKRLNALSDGTIIAERISSFLKDNLKKDEIVIPLLRAMASNDFSMIYLRKDIKLFIDFMKSKNEDISECAQKIVKSLTGAKNNLKKYRSDYTEIEKQRFNVLYHSEGDIQDSYNFLRNIAIVFSDMEFPECYNSILAKGASDKLTQDQFLCMEILLIQNNSKYESRIIFFIDNILKSNILDDKKDRLEFLYSFNNGISYHWINNKDVLTFFMEKLDHTDTYNMALSVIRIFWNVEDHKKEIAKKILSCYKRVKNKNLNDTDILNQMRDVTITTLNDIFLGMHKNNSIHSWQKAIDKMPDDPKVKVEK